MTVKERYSYNNGQAEYIINYKNYSFIGQAFCHPEDEDFANEKVGLIIAERRAIIKLLIHVRDCEILPQLKILNHLYGNMEKSKNFNKKSYEAKMLRSQIKAVKKELTMINNDIADEKQFLKDYINGKEKLYQRLRSNATNLKK